MKRIAKELGEVSNSLMGLLDFTFDGIEQGDYDFINRICGEIDDFADRIRRNEGLDMSVEKVCGGDSTSVKIRMTDHEALKAIKEELARKLTKMSKKKNLNLRVG
jgi:hypothetical protein